MTADVARERGVNVDFSGLKQQCPNKKIEPGPRLNLTMRHR